ncbi:hypothetical protein ACWEBX_03220 [Streptomyces sp. NPDC005070]
MSTDEYARWKSLKIRRPDDVRTSPGGPVPIGWQAEKRHEHADRLGNNLLPADFPYDVERGDAGDALAVLTLGESMRRDLGYERSGRMHTALTLGATWQQVAEALDLTPDEARAVLREYADTQRRSWLQYEAEGTKPFGFSAEQHADVLALCALGDNGEPAGAMTPDPPIKCLVLGTDTAAGD